MKEQVKTPILVAAIAIVVAVVAYFGFKSVANAGNTDQGQIKYTPGVPPWQETDPAKRGPGAAPPAQPQGGTPQGGPPAMAPNIDNGGG